MAAAPSLAAPIFVFSGNSSDGHPVSGSVDFTLNPAADTVTVKLTNSTPHTFDAGELFTGLDFSFGGLTPTLSSVTGILRTINSNGTFSDTGSAQNMSWMLDPLGGGTFQINFHPNARHAIVGPPTAGTYAGANASVRANPGHTPYAAEMAVAQLSVPGLEASTPVNVTAFRYGTDLDPATGTIVIIPEPSTLVLAMVGLALMARRRR
jgi:hypothetical protein